MELIDAKLARLGRLAEAIGLKKGRAEGALQAKAEMLVSILQMRFSESFTQEDQDRIMTLSDTELLNVLDLRAAAAADYAEIREMLE